MPMPPDFREFSQSSAFAARTSEVDSNDRALLKFDMQLAHFLRMLIEKYFLYYRWIGIYGGTTADHHCSMRSERYHQLVSQHPVPSGL